jgi:hypothetical protein
MGSRRADVVMLHGGIGLGYLRDCLEGYSEAKFFDPFAESAGNLFGIAQVIVVFA